MMNGFTEIAWKGVQKGLVIALFLGMSAPVFAEPSHGTSSPSLNRPAAPRSLGVLTGEQEQDAINVEAEQALMFGKAVDNIANFTGSTPHQVGESDASTTDSSTVTRELNSNSEDL